MKKKVIMTKLNFLHKNENFFMSTAKEQKLFHDTHK
jgi:hypothetical protein